MRIKKILIVDDSITDLTNLQKIISEAGHNSTLANSGTEALDKINKESFDLVFMDIVMQDMDGYQTCRKITETLMDVPVVFVTSKKQQADKIWAEMQGAKGFITKPYTSDQIIEKINQFN